ncbi:MAG: hypothetical protein KGL25_02365 [Gammaproteobacteria bacterium]|nr:hypothetical protein [Gammaproteobacteria bacterium]MDE2250234.1 hypothetical protein [Gammaproteobacteria bacterium]
MNEFDLQYTPGMTPRFAPRIPALGLAGLPSFAHALRKRGLVAPVETGNGEAWIPVLSVFEAHLKRRAMEQAFASLRGDHG